MPHPSAVRQATTATVAALRGTLPSHYTGRWRFEFDARVRDSLRPDQDLLDVGAGWEPTVPVEDRPPGCRYVGLDISGDELRRAPAGSYQEIVVADLRARTPALEGRFDLAVSCQTLEHVKPLQRAVDNVQAYLRPGGRFVAFFSGTFSVYGLLNRVLPQRVSLWALQRLLDRPADTVFRAHYDQCWDRALRRVFEGWSSIEIVPCWQGAGYFAFSRPLRAVYVGYEEWARTRGLVNLAPYYLVDATS